ncbi:germacradienol/geosmin synthase [Saccharopolyspora erythraea NRRL 2338]|uniref:Terpene synthase n=2 Tax=Saccharopolyspora erythraea TaxID=1836 RepID=A4FGS3_SACEN|nr:terpene synthase [Saccharopolyspora erythraea]EQD85598.1 Geosmin synthase [Saccharopolyspora erythraea D]PFG96952.1 germacradienol/geosmin synthase [Saccharopolyspora erythraea NRRL 2338]QRK87171.1 germacradienol/geosmin synthase [Saccharopolyspora erythraea]CAM03248.1 terpene synthase, metal binding domain protein [Saccharopolyspora erythraea NRRL 2338]
MPAPQQRQPYRLPAFYLPRPARLNPDLEAARARSRRWAEEMGMLGSRAEPEGEQVWTREDFDRHDYALLCAYAHPDASAPALELITGWYVWAFFFDDHFLARYKRTGDVDGARAHLLGLAELMPVGPSDAAPAATGPVERGLADLWVRTAPEVPARWLVRFAASTRELLENRLRELTGTSRCGVPNPVDHIAMRREAGGASWSAALVEYAAGSEVPDVVARSRPMRVLRDSFCDGVHLRNDIFSYPRETSEEGELGNGVLVVERFFDTDPQEAADTVNDLLTSRLHQFENVTLTELPAMFEEHGLSPVERADVLDYVKGLQDWQSGAHEWHLRSGRYAVPGGAEPREPRRFLSGPHGLGTSSSHLGSLLRTVRPGLPIPHGQLRYARIAVPAMSSPHPVRTNPQVGTVRAHAKEWARRMGMLDGSGVWTANVFDAADFGQFSAMAHPDSPGPELELVNDWHVWGWFFDDFFTEVFKRSRNRAGAEAFLARLPGFMPADTRRTPAPANPVERGLADLWARSTPVLAPRLRRRFPEHVRNFVGSWLWELDNLIQNRVSDPVDYLRMRRRTGGSAFRGALARHTLGAGLAPAVFDTPEMRALHENWADVGPLRNDLFSYHKEVDRETEVTNGVLAVQRFFDCGLQQAAAVVADLAEVRLRRFTAVAEQELPALAHRFEPGRAPREELDRYVRGLHDWLAGELAWSQVTGRYREPSVSAVGADLPAAPLGITGAAG